METNHWNVADATSPGTTSARVDDAGGASTHGFLEGATFSPSEKQWAGGSEPISHRGHAHGEQTSGSRDKRRSASDASSTAISPSRPIAPCKSAPPDGTPDSAPMVRWTSPNAPKAVPFDRPSDAPAGTALGTHRANVGTDSSTGMEPPVGHASDLQCSGRYGKTSPHACRTISPIASKHTPRRRCRKTTESSNVGFLNLNGARRATKWEELFTALHKEEFTLYAVAETHLRGLEEPPTHPNWHWSGCNRDDGERKGGGIGVLWRSDTSWTRLGHSCKEHMWMSGTIVGSSVIVGIIYLSVTRGQHDGNQAVMRCVAEDIKRWSTDSEVVVMGDFNGHLQSIDGYQDFNGDLVLKLAQEFSLEIANMRVDCEGDFTWCVRNSRSCIDYALVSGKLATHITKVHIDESGDHSVGSDHNRVKISFSSSVFRRPTMNHRPAHRYVPVTAFAAIAERFEQSDIHNERATYEEYVSALRGIMNTHEVRANARRGYPRKSWWDREVKTALDARRNANRLHRQAVKAGSAEERQQAWENYLFQKRLVQKVVQQKIAEHDHRQLQDLTTAGREGARRFWKYVGSLDRRAPEPTLREETTGEVIADVERHLTEHIRNIYNSSQDPLAEGARGRRSIIEASGDGCETDHEWEVTRRALDRVISRLGAHTAQGLDGIPAGLIKHLGTMAREHLAIIFTGIIYGDNIPEDWLRGRVCLLLKNGGNPSLLKDHRPLTVTSVLYRVFAKVVKGWVSAWAEASGHLTELQNGFRPRRRLEDNIYVLTQCVDIARKQDRGLVACFLDVSKAYDNVPHDGLLRHLADIGMEPVWVELLHRLYEGNTVVASFGGRVTDPVPVRRGLKQGCPLSPILFMLYAAKIEHAILASKLGFTLRFTAEGLPETWTLPGLVFADDLVLLADDAATLQGLVTVAAAQLGELGLCFNAKKSAVLRFSGPDGGVHVTLPSGDLVPQEESYRYLGVTFSAGKDRYSAHAAHVQQSAQRACRILRKRCLWGCSRYLMVRELWKAVHVPCLTFANAVVCLPHTTRAWLERCQSEVGRVALGCHGCVAKEAIQGDMGWSSFEAREARSKISYEERLRRMEDTRWARRVYRYHHFTGIRTQWGARLHVLRRKFGFFERPTQEPAEQQHARAVQKRVRESETAEWRLAMGEKSTLQLYRDNKTAICREAMFHDSTDGGLLFEARAGALRTLTYRRRYESSPDVQAARCRVCGEAEESIEHIVLLCDSLQPKHPDGVSLPEALGFVAAGAAAGRNAALQVTKERLQRWFKETRRRD